MAVHEALGKELTRADVNASRNWRQRLGTALAFLALVVVDGVMKLAGFGSFYRIVRSFPALGTAGGSERRIESICQAVDRAASLYFKRAWCLQRSATAACLLRLRGVPAELVIGVRKMPFYAHAWVEVDGRVVNDSPVVQSRYRVMERC